MNWHDDGAHRALAHKQHQHMVVQMDKTTHYVSNDFTPDYKMLPPHVGFHFYRAFKALAYKRYQHVPVYLEWAPANIFTADAPKQQPAAQTAKASDAAATAAGGDAPALEAAAAAAALPDTEEADTSTIYVKNLAFATGQDTWDEH